jgi:hypothetical protein
VSGIGLDVGPSRTVIGGLARNLLSWRKALRDVGDVGCDDLELLVSPLERRTACHFASENIHLGSVHRRISSAF